MLLKVWSHHDDVVGMYKELQMFRNDEEAKIMYQRSLKSGLNQGHLTEDMLEDFSFRKVCEFDDETGEVKPCKPVTVKVSAGDI